METMSGQKTEQTPNSAPQWQKTLEKLRRQGLGGRRTCAVVTGESAQPLLLKITTPQPWLVARRVRCCTYVSSLPPVKPGCPPSHRHFRIFPNPFSHENLTAILMNNRAVSSAERNFSWVREFMQWIQGRRGLTRRTRTALGF